MEELKKQVIHQDAIEAEDIKFHKNLYLKSCREVLQWMHLVLTGL